MSEREDLFFFFFSPKLFSENCHDSLVSVVNIVNIWLKSRNLLRNHFHPTAILTLGRAHGEKLWSLPGHGEILPETLGQFKSNDSFGLEQVSSGRWTGCPMKESAAWSVLHADPGGKQGNKVNLDLLISRVSWNVFRSYFC